uniref:pyridoxal biosynthesis lyase PdxS n=1 Tax=Lentilactobacillus hilgardii TaxID=1588 RepID=UPI00403F9E3B
MTIAHDLKAPQELVKRVHKNDKLTVINLAADGVSTPADAALLMNLGSDGTFIGSEIFKSKTPSKFAKAVVQETAHPTDYKLIAEVSKNLDDPMKGIDMSELSETDLMETRGN